jgi:hypothetical protein
MGFELIVSHMESNIFTYSPTFHHTSIDDHDFNFFHRVYKTMVLFFHSFVNEIVSVATIN